MGAQDISKYDFRGKRTLIRVDFNVPIDRETGLVQDDTRIRRSLQTILHVMYGGGRIVLLSHMGRPKGERVESLSLSQILPKLEYLVGKTVRFCNDCIGEEALNMVNALYDGEILLLENLRFHPEEEAKVKRKDGETDEAYAARKAEAKRAQKHFAEQLAQLGDCYVNDAFSVSHREHASVATLATLFPHDRMFGKLMLDEITALDRVVKNPTTPVTAVMGGAKVSDKIELIAQLMERVNRIIIGGGMAYTFVKATGGEIGNSLCEMDHLDTARELLERAKKQGVELILPVDSVNADRFAADAQVSVTPIDQIPNGWTGLDIGPESIARAQKALMDSKTIVWNGPMGVFEMAPFSKGTFAVAEALAQATAKGAFTVVGGGDSVSALAQSGKEEKVSYVCTGGGAMLEYMEGKRLPGIVRMEE